MMLIELITWYNAIAMFKINEDEIPYPYERYRQKIKDDLSFSVTGLTAFLRIFLLSKINTYAKKKILFITSTEESAVKYQSDIKTIFDLDSEIMPFQDVSMYEAVSPNLYDYAKQIEILRQKPNIVICPVKALLEKFPNEDFFKKNSFKIKIGDTIDLAKLSRKLVDLGYKKETMVNDVCEFSIRGDIADIYSLNKNPVRIELWGDEVVDIRYFNNETQKSVEKTKETTITPVYKFITAGQEDVVKQLQENNEEEITEDNYFEGIEIYQNYFNKNLVGILDYLKDYTIVLDESTEIFSKYEMLDEDCNKRLAENIKNNLIKSIEGKNHFSYEEFIRQISYFQKIGFNNFIDGEMLDLIEFNAQPLRNFEANIEELSNYIKNHKDYKTIIATDYPDRVNEILSEKDIYNIEYSDIFIIPEKTNSDIINLVITVTKSDADEIDLYYLEDYNIIPYSRNKAELINKITLKKNKREYILLNNFLKDDKASHLNNEVFYIYLSFEHHISMNYELQYSNYQILEENNQMLVSPGLNKIYIGYENDNYLIFDKCGNSDISFSIFQNEEIIQQNLVITDNKNIISCSKIDKEGYLSLEINNPEKFLISLSHENISLLNNFAYNYDIDLSIDENSKNLIINYYPVSNIPQIEYHIFIIDKNYYDNLNDHCFINEHINNIYIKKYLFLSNGEEEILSHRLKITDEIKCNEVYSFLIIAKEIIKDYPNYHYYTPKNFFISEEICNANNANYTKPYFLLGIDGFKYNIAEQKAVFNLFFATKLGESFPDYIYLYLIINYKKLRYLESDESEGKTIKSKCNFISNNIKNQIKYVCNFGTNGEDIINITSSDIIEFNYEEIEIQFSSFFNYLYKNSIQNIQGYIFNKPLIFIEDAAINSNEKEFNIIGRIEKQLKYDSILLLFHYDKNNEEFLTTNCKVIYNEDKCILNCFLDEPKNIEIIDGYSNLEDEHLIVMFLNRNNKIEMISDTKEKKKGLSAGAIVGIVFAVIVIIAGIILAIFFIIKKKKENNKNETKSEKIPL